MGMPSDDFVVIRPPETAGEPTVVTVNCPDKTGLGCDLCRVILFFGLSIVRGDVSTDGKWCFILFWVVGRGVKATRWSLLKKRLLEACPAASSASGLYNYYYEQQEMMLMEQQPQIFLLKFCCYDRMGLLHDVTQVLCELELTIMRVKVSTTPDGRVVDLFFITDTREQNRKRIAATKLRIIQAEAEETAAGQSRRSSSRSINSSNMQKQQQGRSSSSSVLEKLTNTLPASLAVHRFFTAFQPL